MEAKNKKIYEYIYNNRIDIKKVIKDYSNYVYTIINNSYLKLSNEDMEEIISDVFVVLWSNQEKLNINNSISAYIAGITKNLIRQKGRYIKINHNIDDYEESLVSSLNVETSLFRNEDYIKIMKKLEKMKAEDREIFNLYYYEEKKIKDICMIYGMSESKVKSKLFRIRKKLQKALNGKGDDINE